MARVGEDQAHARIEEGELAVAVLELLEIELGDVLEGVGRGEEGDAGALLAAGRGADDLQRRDGVAVAKRIQCSSPSRQMVSSSHSLSALTTETPTPWRPPETL